MKKHFSISTHPVSLEEVKTFVHQSETGATVVFEGIVRPDTMPNQEQVANIEYEGLTEMALSELEKIALSIQERYEIQSLYFHHLLGKVDVGQTAVWVGIGAKHRKDAFGALDLLMDEVKKTVPIFKKEISQQQSAHWVVPNYKDES